VAGYVKNLEDGRVELWIEGEEEELDRFEHAIEQAMHNYIKDIDSNEVDLKDLEMFQVQD
jgi:acylphosphatase